MSYHEWRNWSRKYVYKLEFLPELPWLAVVRQWVSILHIDSPKTVIFLFLKKLWYQLTFQRQNLLWPFNAETVPWFLQRAHFGVRGDLISNPKLKHNAGYLVELGPKSDIIGNVRILEKFECRQHFWCSTRWPKNFLKIRHFPIISELGPSSTNR